jgi:uncharacterized caspase-like protein
MKRTTSILATALIIVPLFSPQASAQSRAELAEARSEHPEVARAIDALEDAIEYLEKEGSPVFGRYGAEAIEESRQARAALREALGFSARGEERRKETREERGEESIEDKIIDLMRGRTGEERRE